MVTLSLALAATTFALYFRAPTRNTVRGRRATSAAPAGDAADRQMGEWIRHHTDRRATFLIDPTLDTFYVDAERAAFVSFKHAPQAERDLRNGTHVSDAPRAPACRMRAGCMHWPSCEQPTRVSSRARLPGQPEITASITC